MLEIKVESPGLELPIIYFDEYIHRTLFWKVLWTCELTQGRVEIAA